MRRNIHRIEKGLLMRPRRAVFAEEYIGETVEAFGGDTVRGGSPCFRRRACSRRFTSSIRRDDRFIDTQPAVLALDCLGLAFCPINWPDVEQRERQIERLLGLSPAQRVVMLIAVGFADPEGLIPFSQKKTLSVLVRRV